MSYDKKIFLKAVEESFEAYKEKGAQSTVTLKSLYRFLAETLAEIWGGNFEVKYSGDGGKEQYVEGKYYRKNPNIVVLDGEKPVFCLGVKFAGSNYRQNSGNSCFETMMGETTNIQSAQIPYAHLIILRQPSPCFTRKSEAPIKWENIKDRWIKKYSDLISSKPQAHRPAAMAVPILTIDEKTAKTVFCSLGDYFSEPYAAALNGKLSLENFFKEIAECKNRYLSRAE